MPDLLRLDIGALCLCVVLSTSLMLVVGGAGLRKSLNRRFLLVAAAESAWAVTSLILKLMLWFKAGDAHLLLEMATLSFSLLGPALLLFTARYVGVDSPWLKGAAAAAAAAAAVLAVPLFNGRLLSDPFLDPRGTTLYDISPAGLAASAIPGLCIAVALVLFWVRRSAVREPSLALSVAVTFAGFVIGGLSQLPVPVMPLTNTVSVGLMGWAIMRRQLFNPLRDYAADLHARAERLELISQVGRRTTILLEVDELLQQAVELIRDTFSYFSVGILLVEDGELVLRASTLPAIRERREPFRLPLGQGITGSVAASGKPLLVHDVAADPRYVTLEDGVPTASELAVPILRGGRVIGVLDIQSTRPSGFSEADLATQQTVADQLSTAVENARLYGETRRRAGRLGLVNRISSAVGALLTLPDLLETVSREVVPIFEADAFFIALYDPAADELDFRIQEDEGVRDPPRCQPVGTGLTSRVIRDGRPLLLNDLQGTAGGFPAPELWGTGKMPSSWLGVPLRVADRLIGVMSVQTYRPHRYTEEDTLLASTIADQVAVAIENARLYEEVRLDLAERGRTEKVLRESEEKFRNLAEQSPNMIFIWGVDRILYANRQCELALGWTREEYYDPGFDFLSVIAPEHKALMAVNHARHLRGEEVPPCQYAARTRKGTLIDVIVTTKLLRYDGMPAILSIITDITAHTRAETLLQSLNSAALAMERALAPGEIFPAVARQLAGMGFSSLVFFSDAPKRRLTLRWYGNPREGVVTVPESGEPPGLAVEQAPFLERALLSRRTILTTLDGGILALLARTCGVDLGPSPDTGSPEPPRMVAAPLSVADDSFGVLAVSAERLGEEDREIVTAFAHQAAAAWRKATLVQDLESSLTQLKKTQEQLLHAQKLEAIGRLAGGIAHDFNNLLTVISGYTNLLTDSLTGNEPALADLGEIRNAIKRAAALTGRLLAFSRKQVLQPTVLDMNRVIASSVNLLRPLIGEDVELGVSLCREPACVRADPYQIEQVIVNLAVNARDAMPGGGRLTVSADILELSEADGEVPPGGWILLTVADTGTGMSDEVKEHLFEPFFTTKEDGKGTGLGLSTVYGIVAQTGGQIRVTSSPGAGSSFAVYLPVARSASERACPEDGPAAHPGGSGSVLVVEDEQTVRELSRRVLEQGGYSVRTASSPQEALEIAEAGEPIDLLLTDVVMPGGMNGVQLGRELARRRPGMKVLHMSGYTDDEAVQLGMADRKLGFLSKPFQPSELLRRVAQVMRGEAGT